MDIDGASLAGRHPNKLTKQELRFWLDCRAISHKKLKTKAELVTRYVVIYACCVYLDMPALLVMNLYIVTHINLSNLFIYLYIYLKYQITF